jgi:hypothetical protein
MKPLLGNFMPVWRLTCEQKSLNELTFTANRKAGKCFEPFACWNLRFGVQPPRQQNELFAGNVSFHAPVSGDEQAAGQEAFRGEF